MKLDALDGLGMLGVHQRTISNIEAKLLLRDYVQRLGARDPIDQTPVWIRRSYHVENEGWKHEVWDGNVWLLIDYSGFDWDA